ncbi:MAG: hypothetical protein ABGZ24_06730 [Fuerstiella sp.]
MYFLLGSNLVVKGNSSSIRRLSQPRFSALTTPWLRKFAAKISIAFGHRGPFGGFSGDDSFVFGVQESEERGLGVNPEIEIESWNDSGKSCTNRAEQY